MNYEESLSLNFINKTPEELGVFLLKYEELSGEKAKELQNCILENRSKKHLGDEKKLKKYSKLAARHENIKEGDGVFDARLIHTTRIQLNETLNQLGRHDSTISEDMFLSDIGTSGGKTTFSLLHMKDRKNIGILAIDDDALWLLPKEKRETIVRLLQRRCDIGNHDRFHNISFDTIEGVLAKEYSISIKKNISNKIGELVWKHPDILIPLFTKHPHITRFYEKITTHVDNNPDLYVKTKKMRYKYIKTKKRKIDIPNIMGGGRTRRNVMGLQSEWTALYEYLSILMHFRTLQIMFKKHPHIKQKIISESRDFFSLIQGLDIEQKSKEYWIGNYALFTSRIINFDEIGIKEIESILPEVYHAGKHDLYAINQALVQDNKRIDEGYSIT